ncbi:MAG: leucyl aminopeptidase [Planctomycetota bacterium]|jgi:leucyl aminopeptidase
MKLTFKSAAKLAKTDALVLFRIDGEDLPTPSGVEAVELPAAFRKNCSGSARKASSTYASGGPAQRVITVGLGKRAKVDCEGLRRAAAVAIKQLEAAGCAKATLIIDDGMNDLAGGEFGVGEAIAEGATMATYKWQGRKSKPSKAKLIALTVVGSGAKIKAGVKSGQITAAANMFTRDLQNKAGNDMTPRMMAAEAKTIASRSPRISFKALDEKAMKALGMNLLLSVSRGSVEPARLIHLIYKPKGKSKGCVALVGKGLTFDSGGISLKPGGKMDEMRYDMSGGAAVLGAFHALAEMDVPVEVHGIVPSSENMPDAEATKPGDIFAGMDGTTVEVLNTDAEGRLILADALTYAVTKVKPDTIIDAATLTGAVIVALGHELSAAYPRSTELRDGLVEAGLAAGERVWPMPLLDVHEDAVKGTGSDLKNISSPAVGGGSITAAAFLSHFVPKEFDWCHLDIAGTAWNTKDRDWVGGALGSGVGTRLFIKYLLSRN